MLKSLVNTTPVDVDPTETAEWLESLADVRHRHGPERVAELLGVLQEKARRTGIDMPFQINTPYVNTIPASQQPAYPGDRTLERRIKSINRWNAMVMVLRANKGDKGLGGHISTYASAATLLEVGFNHFFRGIDANGGDLVYFQGHSSPGIYARAFLEGRLTEQQVDHFRSELAPGGGLSSYPHPWLMPDFWQFPTVSMGIGPLTSIYQARFIRYLEDRGLANTQDRHVWCFIGDGEVDEPETLGGIHLASRESLDNLIFVINCNLQRLDGPVRGNGKVIQELEAFFRGAGWNVIKVIWGNDWDPLLDADTTGNLTRRMGEVLDGEYQKYVVEDGAYFRENFFGGDPDLLRLVEHIPDEKLHKLRRGGHDPEKVHAAYKAAVENIGAPTVILAKTVKGYGLGEGGEGANTTHQLKKLKEERIAEFRDRFGIPIADDKLNDLPFYLPPPNSPEIKYLKERRAALGGAIPARRHAAPKVAAPTLEEFGRLLQERTKPVATTMSFVEMLLGLMRHKEIGKYVVPIIPDEARTFGMEGVISLYSIYSPVGQLYEPVDANRGAAVMPYKEAKTGQVLEEGINEAGAISSFMAAGTAYANHGVPMIPFYIYYSMFGFQRVGDFIWAAADSRCRGFLLGATAGRTSLNGEGLQHQDGHSHLLAATIPSLVAYDPAYGYELAVIIRDGLRRMMEQHEDVIYYLTVYNDTQLMPAMPAGVESGIIKGMYKLRSKDAAGGQNAARPQLLGSGPILANVIAAQAILAEKYGIGSDVWSVTSYKELRRDALAVDRWNLLHPDQPPRASYLHKQLATAPGPYVAASDNMRLVAEQIAPWTPGGLTVLGTDGFGRSDTRDTLRKHFEINAEFVVFATLSALAKRGQFDKTLLSQAIRDLGIDPEKIDPASA